MPSSCWRRRCAWHAAAPGRPRPGEAALAGEGMWRAEPTELLSFGETQAAPDYSASVSCAARPMVDLVRAVERSVEERQPRTDLGGADRIIENLAHEELGFGRLDQKDNLKF